MSERAAVSAETRWLAYRQEFPIFERLTYFNSCSLGALSRRVVAAIATFTELWDARGAAAWYGPWLEESEHLRSRFAALIGASAEEVAIFPSVTSALTSVASCFDYRSRPRVVLSELEFPTTVYQWLTKASLGVQLQRLRSQDRMTVALDDYERAVDPRTQLVVGSHVYFTSGMIQDVAALARLAHSHGAYCLIDAYQSIGQLPVNVREAGVDFLVTGGLKWLLGGPGVAYLYVRREVAGRLQPSDVGWFAHRRQFDFDITTFEFEYAEGARRFEGGTPSVAAIYAGRAGLEIVREIGVEALRARQVELMRSLVEAARRAGLRPRVPQDLNRLAGILTLPRQDPRRVVSALAERGVVVDSRPGLIRLSPYFYNTVEDCDRVVQAVTDLERSGVAS
ncbi:MAG: aminotransferase class V-fold PLP-dependent enzyme [Armatimonadetes bacterium]|nr:aminotransferase class V-fold PLP-dependent enzyme [Armatimonadota bacterium]MBI2201631.1 aminotransferase class V-fold PLP-dependent enzyme [Armatimonadota bacterium]